MRWFEYENKETKEKAKAVDVLSLIEEMSGLEEFNGSTKEKTVENYYDLKKQLREILVSEAEEERK